MSAWLRSGHALTEHGCGLRADAERDDRLVRDQEPPCPGDGVEDRGDVERRDGPQVDHLDRAAVLRQALGRGEGLVDHPRDRHHRDVAPRPHHARGADGDDVVTGAVLNVAGGYLLV